MVSPREVSTAELYDWECEHVTGRRAQDLEWYRRWATVCGGPVLELACGTGRVGIPLARSTGLAVVGLDNDPAMLARARARGARQLVRADMRRFHLARRFALVLIPYNSLQLLDDGGMHACLVSVAAHLAGGGLLAFECTDFQHGAMRAAVEDVDLASAPLPSGAMVTLRGGLRHDLVARTSVYRRTFTVGATVGATVVMDEVRLRSLDRAELEPALAAAGLEPHTVVQDGSRLWVTATTVG